MKKRCENRGNRRRVQLHTGAGGRIFKTVRITACGGTMAGGHPGGRGEITDCS